MRSVIIRIRMSCLCEELEREKYARRRKKCKDSEFGKDFLFLRNKK